MGDDKQQTIINLYVKNKLSMMQIAQRLNLSASGVGYYLHKNGVQKRSVSDAITNLHITKFNKRPFKLKNHLTKKEEELKIAGAMLYWGEGSKNGNTVKFTNSNPGMIRLFLKFLRIVCGVSEDRLKALIHMYPDHNKKEIELFWSRATKIPSRRFYLSYIHKGKPGTYKNKSPYGTIALNYSDKRLLMTILQWIKEYEKKLMA